MSSDSLTHPKGGHSETGVVARETVCVGGADEGVNVDLEGL